MADSPELVIEQQLRAALGGLIRLEEQRRAAEQEVARILNLMKPLNLEVQRLRMALFALAGETNKNMGDANSANHQAMTQIRSELRGVQS